MGYSDRREYLTATVLNQAFLDRAQDALENKLELIVDVETPSGTIYASDRNKYMGGIFYEALTEFPSIRRSIGEWLSPEIEFSRLTISLSNVDGRFNDFLAGGASFGGWINKQVTVKVGLRDVASTYTTLYQGRITEIGGFQRDREKITLITRDNFDKVNRTFPTAAFTKTSFPDLDDGLVGRLVPVIYGDWTVQFANTRAAVKAFPINGLNAGVIAGTTSVRCVVSFNDNTFLDTTRVYLRRGDQYYLFDSGDISIFGAGNKVIDILQANNGGTTVIDPDASITGFIYQTGDEFLVRVKGKDLGAYDDNLVEQAKDILITFGGALSGDFDSTWNYFRDKASPAESAISTIKCRVWIQDAAPAMQYALSMLEQVRLEAFISREQKFRISSLHFDEFQASPGFKIRNWDIKAGSFNPQLDDRNVWNRAAASYSFDPAAGENAFETPIYRNSAAISQVGKEISKKVVFPNLYEEATVILQLKEMIKLSSGYAEFIETTLTSRAVLKDIGDFVLVNVQMGSTILENVPAMIRDIGYDPEGPSIPVKLWSLQMLPFPGYSPGYAGIVGGSTATITEET